MEFKNIAVSGRIGAGTSTLAKQLSQVLGWPLRDASQIFRDVTAQIGLNLEVDINQAVENRDDQIDVEVDRKTLEVLNGNTHVVVTSKLAGFLSREVKHTLRVLITCPLDERIRRYAQNRGYSLDQAKKLLILREKLDQEKWQRLYGTHDFFGPKYFQLVLDSRLLSPQDEVHQILSYLNKNTAAPHKV